MLVHRGGFYDFSPVHLVELKRRNALGHLRSHRHHLSQEPELPLSALLAEVVEWGQCVDGELHVRDVHVGFEVGLPSNAEYSRMKGGPVQVAQQESQPPSTPRWRIVQKTPAFQTSHICPKAAR
jgi:hypothetical protein